MIKLLDILKEITLNEFQKSQVDFIANKLNISNDDILKSILNSFFSFTNIKLTINNICNLIDISYYHIGRSI